MKLRFVGITVALVVVAAQALNLEGGDAIPPLDAQDSMAASDSILVAPQSSADSSEQTERRTARSIIPTISRAAFPAKNAITSSGATWPAAPRTPS